MRRYLQMLGIAAFVTVASQGQSLGARDLFYESNSPISGDSQSAAGAKHFGLRYTLLKVNPDTRAVEVVDPTRNFRDNDCFAIEFMANQSGNLFVFDAGTSGRWQALLPSSDMPEEKSVVKAGATVRVPVEYCFQLEKKGIETLSVVVTNNVVDADRLRSLSRASSGGAQQVSAQVKDWQKQQMVSRDIVFETSSAPGAGPAAPNSVYAVQTGPSRTGRIVIEIRIRHE